MRKVTVVLAVGIGLAVLAGGLHLAWQGVSTRAAQVKDDKKDDKGAGKQTAGPGVPVETATARPSTSSSDIHAIGSLQSDESVQIAPEIAGRISEIAFREGEPVREGEILVKFDDSLVAAEVAEQEARYALAKSNLDRAEQLGKTGNVTLRARDEATAAFESTRATLELVKVRHQMHTLRAPFSGVVGLRTGSVGAFVSVGTAIVNLEKIDSLKVDFSIPELHLRDVAVGQHVQVSVDALPDKVFAGSIYAINPMVDVNGRALRIRARLPNVDGTLRPGLFARLTVEGPKKQNVVVVPESAIVPQGSDAFVYRVENGTAVQVKVRLGQRRAGFATVLEGLEPDAVVITAGQQRLRNGARVEVVASAPQSKG
jgi:membrane fusion protein, multidrug efflux system